MDKNIQLYEDKIKAKIHTIRGLQVMLDKDLAEFYEVKTKALNQAVKRNRNKFPKDFMFQLSEKELDLMVSQNVTPSKMYFGGNLPYAFTQEGVATLSGVLKSKKATKVHIQIMRAFVSMRRFILSNAQIFQRLDNLEINQLENNKNFKILFDAIESRQITPKQGIFFEGQIFDAHKFVSDLIKSANKSIILIDNYVDDSVLTLFNKRKKGVNVTIYTKNISPEFVLDLEKYNLQYPKIEIKEFTHSHDRFMIIDNKEVYHIGASLKDLGKKWFAFSRFDNHISGFRIMLEKIQNFK